MLSYSLKYSRILTSYFYNFSEEIEVMQKLMGLVRRCVEDYDMIQPGDKIAVGVSGGKDSLALLVLLAGLNLWLALRVGVLEEQVAALQSQAEELDPAELVADWGFKVISFSSAGRTVEFQVTTARYDPAEELEVFFLIVNGHQQSRRAEAVMNPEAPGVYTARVVDEDLSLLSGFTLSAGFVRDGVEYVCPLAEFSGLTDKHSSYTSLWP